MSESTISSRSWAHHQPDTPSGQRISTWFSTNYPKKCFLMPACLPVLTLMRFCWSLHLASSDACPPAPLPSPATTTPRQQGWTASQNFLLLSKASLACEQQCLQLA